MISSQRMSKYSRIKERDVPALDIFRIGNYREVNEGYVYFVRNNGKYDFTIVMKKQIVADEDIREENLNGQQDSRRTEKRDNQLAERERGGSGRDPSSDFSASNGGAVQENDRYPEENTASGQRIFDRENNSDSGRGHLSFSTRSNTDSDLDRLAENAAKGKFTLDEGVDIRGMAKKAEKSTFVDDATGENVRYSLRSKPDPEPLRNPDGSIKYVYKAFYARDGKLYPPMIKNLGETDQKVSKAVSGTLKGLETPVGVWIDADVGALARNPDGTALRNSRGRLAVVNDKGGGTLAFRPGWHLGEWPDAKQFNKGPIGEDGKRHLMPDSLVFAKCIIAGDVDYQLDAMSYGMNAKGKFSRSQAGLPRILTDGYYKYRTNADPDTAPWYITGAMKIVEILDDKDCAEICAEYGVTADPRESGKPINLADYGLRRGAVEPTGDLDRFKKNSKNFENERALQEELNNPDYADAYTPYPINFDNIEIRKEFARNGQDAEYYRGRISLLQSIPDGMFFHGILHGTATTALSRIRYASILMRSMQWISSQRYISERI